MNEQQLEQALHQLDNEISPQRDLWPGIAARLQNHVTACPEQAPATQRAKSKWQSPASAAAIVLVALLGWQFATLAPPAQHTAAMPSAELQLLQVFEQQKARQLAQIVAIADGFDNWQQQLIIWDQAIAQVRQALQLYPDEPRLLAQLQQLYQQQLAYIERATLQQPLVIS
ncbi:hypothetical protein WG68_11500 [Arsukibacterium ikkense]|uniref:Uncharacterized protein n=1 Tax=Arsukibacterium ikkense TaxID=336831 RepID=A0A0M2V4K9_9GAMM|nr:hypothetical protein [Arsukibacterium ikkense]KKO45339.1 hypothetical protein WG68_11500 [Arsukibacterium ikkense]